MIPFYLSFASEVEAKSVLAAFIADGEWLTASHDHALDPVGVLYAPAQCDAAGQEVVPAMPLPGWHVNLLACELPEAALPYLVTPATPQRGFALPPPEVQDLVTAKTAKLAQINAAARAALSRLVSDLPRNEVDSWPQQVKEAEALAGDEAAPVPLLTQIAAERGLSVSDLAARVLVKAAIYADASGQIIGRRQALESAIEAATTIEQLEAIACDFA